MSLTKLLKSPIKLFKKEVITFVTIRRYDLGLAYESLRYIAVRPSASISVLRQKVWHLLDLPDYCEEMIILKSPAEVEIPLAELKKGNDPYRPYILEVWLPGIQISMSSTKTNNMLMECDQNVSKTIFTGNVDGLEKKADYECVPQPTISNESVPLKTSRVPLKNVLYADTKKSEISCRLSTCSIFKLNGRKSRDSDISGILLKIQRDLSNLTNKLEVLESKIPE